MLKLVAGRRRRRFATHVVSSTAQRIGGRRVYVSH